MNLYWGDVHNHCGISYGYGSLENALLVAREQLDFCSVTGHATWYDVPKPLGRLEQLVNYHKKGFEKLKANWDKVSQIIEEADIPKEFITFQSYEAHSSKYGDYHILSPSVLPIIEAGSPIELITCLEKEKKPAIAIPHHVAYIPGYRGINWQTFSSNISPVVEVYSKHGCGMSDLSPYPYLHEMGPRDSRTSIRQGLSLGHRFGFVASTDHHAGYPGSYGDGRLAAWAMEKTREAIWESILSRRTYAVTGDKIVCQFQINGAEMGSEIKNNGTRKIRLDIRACNFLDKIIVYKNSKPWKTTCREQLITPEKSETYKVRLEMGWGDSLEGFLWHGSVLVRDGAIVSLEPCFRGRNVLGPDIGKLEDFKANNLKNSILKNSKTEVQWECTTFKNFSTLHPSTAALIFEIQGDELSTLNISLNGKKVVVSVGELLRGSLGFQLESYNFEAFLIYRAVPEAYYCFHYEWIDNQIETSCDVYDVEIRQINGQCAWISPIFVITGD